MNCLPAQLQFKVPLNIIQMSIKRFSRYKRDYAHCIEQWHFHEAKWHVLAPFVVNLAAGSEVGRITCWALASFKGWAGELNWERDDSRMQFCLVLSYSALISLTPNLSSFLLAIYRHNILRSTDVTKLLWTNLWSIICSSIWCPTTGLFTSIHHQACLLFLGLVVPRNRSI